MLVPYYYSSCYYRHAVSDSKTQHHHFLLGMKFGPGFKIASHHLFIHQQKKKLCCFWTVPIPYINCQGFRIFFCHSRGIVIFTSLTFPWFNLINYDNISEAFCLGCCQAKRISRLWPSTSIHKKAKRMISINVKKSSLQTNYREASLIIFSSHNWCMFLCSFAIPFRPKRRIEEPLLRVFCLRISSFSVILSKLNVTNQFMVSPI